MPVMCADVRCVLMPVMGWRVLVGLLMLLIKWAATTVVDPADFGVLVQQVHRDDSCIFEMLELL
jgi:hypothetical protein